MNGSGRLGIRRFCRLAGCVAALAALSAMTLPSVAAAKPPKIRMTYLSLGDSLAFGYSTQVFNEHLAEGDPATFFEHGYSDDYFAKVNAAKGGKVQLVNDGCPGETTESLIGNNAALLTEINEEVEGKVNEPVTGEAPCAYQAAGLPLHHPYNGKSQLESALETIASTKAERKPVTGITLDIGSNDTLHFIAKIEKEVEARQAKIVETKAKKAGEDAIDEEVEGEAATRVGEFLYVKAGEQCEADDPGHGEEFCASEYDSSGHSFREVFELQYKETHEKEIAELYRQYEKEFVPNNRYPDEVYAEAECENIAHPNGPAFCESEYDSSGHTYKEVFEGKYLEAYAKEVGEEFAEDYLEEHGAELAAEGKLIAQEAIEHGSPALFEQIITNEIGILTSIRHTGYKGKITFVGAYDPYGRVKFLSVEHKELAPGFNALLAVLNGGEKVALHKHPMKACYANSEPTFNPASLEESPTVATEEEEENRLFAWTNMANGNTTNVSDSATIKSGSPEITAIAVPQFLAKGDKVSGAGIPAGTTVVSVNNGGKTAILSKAATESNTEGITIGKKDGGDIHPTKEGYEVMAGIINECPF